MIPDQPEQHQSLDLTRHHLQQHDAPPHPSAQLPARRYAVILLAHGTPDELSEIPAYLSNVVSGRPMPQHVIDEITHRYGLIGKSPLTALTLQQGRLLSEVLNLPVYVGMRNWKPYIVDTLRRMKADGITDAVAICLAPQNSRTSTGLYRRAVYAEAAGAAETASAADAPTASSARHAIRIDFIEGWADHPKLTEAFAARLAPVLDQLGSQTGIAPAVLFTAHSVPCRTIQTPAAGAPAGRPLPGPGTNKESSSNKENGSTHAAPGSSPTPQSAVILSEAKDLRLPSSSATSNAQPAPAASVRPDSPEPVPATWVRSSAETPTARPTPPPDPYPIDAKRTAALVAAQVGLPADRWYFAFQSQGMAGGPWIGPTVEDTLTALRAQGARNVVLHTIGFLCDHVEILYDIDIAFKDFARNLGMRLERPASLNDSPQLTEALADLARQGLARLAAEESSGAAAIAPQPPQTRPQNTRHEAPSAQEAAASRADGLALQT